MRPYDLIVIGSGPGGQRSAIQGAKAGKRVAVTEKHGAIGGVCINAGTIPSKTMREAALHLSGFYSKNLYGANHAVIATGTKPAANSKVPINGRNIIDSDQILSMPRIPRTLIVVGGGVIGVEYACMFATLGVRVIIV